MKKFNESRTYGIEIEFLGGHSTRQAVCDLINEKGVPCRYEDYNHNTTRYWKIITDASCGSELVSPILKGREGLEQLKKVTEALEELDIKVDRKCGLHIHHDVNDFGIKEMKNLFTSYVKFEKLFDSMLPKSRRGNNNQYCQTMRKYGTEGTLEQLRNAKTITDLQQIFYTRYVKLNIQSYVRYGTVEFRQHSGTIEFEKIYNWILLTQRLVETATERNMQFTMTETWNDMGHFASVLSLIKSKGADEELQNVLKFYRGRIKQLAA